MRFLPRFRSLAGDPILLFPLLAAVFLVQNASAGGPRYVAGVSYFNPAVLGQPVVWQTGHVSYFVDQGGLGTLSNTQAKAIVDSAAAVWNNVPTAAVSLIDGGFLSEDVNGSNVVAGNGIGVQAGNGLAFTAPSDVSPFVAGKPIGVVFDTDGSVLDALEGQGASEPDNCEENGLLFWIDNIATAGTMTHGIVILNGRCATTPSLLAMMSYQLERAFGQLLGLDYSQVNDNAENLTATEPTAELGWPVMQPINHQCGPSGGTCIPNPASLRYDDIAALSRLYPVTAANVSSFPGKVLTAANTVSIQGTISFPDGQGMQGVNVVARPLDGNGNPLYQYTVTFVSGSYFNGNHGNPVTGFTDVNGNRFDRFGSNNPALEGFFDLSAMPLPPGVTSASYQVSFEAVNPLYTNAISVGPYLEGSPSPYGTLATVQVNNLQAGSVQTVTVGPPSSEGNNAGSQPRRQATLDNPDSGGGLAGSELRSATPGKIFSELGVETNPDPLPTSGLWTGSFSTVGATDWFLFPVRANRTFTVVAQALDPTGLPTAVKAMPAIGVWDGFDTVQVGAALATNAQDGVATGETWLQVVTSVDDTIRLGIADQRGDGRPDYPYRGWVLYADTVTPTRLPASGGSIVIRGHGFRSTDAVEVGGVPAQVIEILPTEILALAPPAGSGVSGSQDVTVSDLPIYNAVATISGGLSYDSAAGDALRLIAAPSSQTPLNVPQPFTILAVGADGNPAAGVTVTYSVTSGTAALGCGQAACSVTASGDGRATLPVAATNTSVAVVTAALTNGASLQAHFAGVAPAAISAITPTLYLAAGATFLWPVSAIAQSANLPAAGVSVTFKSATGIVAPTAAVVTNAAGIASATLTVGPLAEGQSASAQVCLTSTTTCSAFNAFGSRPEFASLAAVSGVSQSLAAGATPAPVVLRVLDTDNNPMAGATVTVNQALYAWAPPCPARGRCPQQQLLAKQSATLTSALDGSISITPLSLSGVPTSLQGLAATGNAGAIKFAIEEHP